MSDEDARPEAHAQSSTVAATIPEVEAEQRLGIMEALENERGLNDLQLETSRRPEVDIGGDVTVAQRRELVTTQVVDDRDRSLGSDGTSQLLEPWRRIPSSGEEVRPRRIHAVEDCRPEREMFGISLHPWKDPIWSNHGGGRLEGDDPPARCCQPFGSEPVTRADVGDYTVWQKPIEGVDDQPLPVHRRSFDGEEPGTVGSVEGDDCHGRQATGGMAIVSCRVFEICSQTPYVAGAS